MTKTKQSKHSQLIKQSKKVVPVARVVVPNFMFAELARTLLGIECGLVVATIKGDIFSTLRGVSQSLGLSEGLVHENLQKACLAGLVERRFMHESVLYRLCQSVAIVAPKVTSKKTRLVPSLQVLGKWIAAHHAIRIDNNFNEFGKRLRTL